MVRHLDRWATRALVGAGLVGLCVVAGRYTSYVPVWNDTACERNPDRCDEVLNVAGQRGLFGWFVAWAVVVLLGLLATVVRRRLRPRMPFERVAAPVPRPPWRHALWAGGVTAVALLVGIGLFPVWLFGGTAVVLAVLVSLVVALSWLLDLLHRTMSPADPDVAALLTALAAATATLAGAPLGVRAWSALDLGGPGERGLGEAFVALLLGASLAAGATVLVVRGLTEAGRVGPDVAGAAAFVAVLVLAPLGVGTAVGTSGARDLAGSVRDELYPDPPRPSAARPTPPTGPSASTPSTTAPVEPAPAPTTPAPPVVPAARPCAPADLTLSAEGWDSAMGSSALSLVATNASSTSCWLEGFATLRLEQGGVDLHLRVSDSTTGWTGTPMPRGRVGLQARGGRALVALWWRGYRSAADQQTAQTVVVGLRGAAPMRLELPAGGPLLDVVDGAVVTASPWQAPRPS